jgi:hypothetical protein
MKTINNNIQTLVRRWGKVPVSLILALALVLVLAASAMAELPNTLEWTGQGSGSLRCDLTGTDEYRTEDGWIHWIVTQARNVTEAELVLGGSGSGTYDPTRYGATLEFFTPYFEIETLTATLHYAGTLGRNSQLVISDYCPGGEEDLEVSKTAFTSFTREHFWDIDKSVETENGEMLNGYPKIWLDGPGDEGDETATWTIDVTYEGYEDSGFNVSGEIFIENIGTLTAVILSVEDVLAGMPIDVVCGVTFPHDLLVGETLTCTYDEDVESMLEGYNEVTVTTERDEYFADAEIIWGDPDVEINETVNIKDISDLFGEVDLGSVTAPNGAQFTYEEDFAWEDYKEFCGEGFTYENTAMIVETGQEAEAVLKVNVRCEILDVSKTVVTTFNREHFWDIDKFVETDNGYFINGTPKIWLYTDGSGDEAASWTVDVTYEGYVDSGFNVSGEIIIENAGQLVASITDVDDVLGGMPISVDCGVGLPYDLPVGETLVCTYDEDGYVEGDNEVTVITLRDTYFADAPIVWGAPATEINKTVNIIDSMVGYLGEVTAPNDAQFVYALFYAFENFIECGSFQIDNTATIVETGQEADATLKVNVQCVIYESAWAQGVGAGVTAYAFCDNGFSNWGWSNKIGQGYEGSWPLWAGAGQCDPAKGTLVGSVSVVYDVAGNVTVIFNIDPGYLLGSTAVYADYPMFPTTPAGNPTTAPGQYYNASPFDGSDVFVIAHANVGMPDPNFGP